MASLHLLQESNQKLDLKVIWKGKELRVLGVMQQRPISIVLLVAIGRSQRRKRIIKIFPVRTERGLYKLAFKRERRAYRLLAGCPVIPRFYGHCLTTTLIYSDNSRLPEDQRLIGEHPSIMLEYLDDAASLTTANFTLENGRRAIEALKTIHSHGVCHGDINDVELIKNVMIDKEGNARWLDFDRAVMGERLADKGWGATEDKLEQGLAEALLGSNGTMQELCRIHGEMKLGCGDHLSGLSPDPSLLAL